MGRRTIRVLMSCAALLIIGCQTPPSTPQPTPAGLSALDERGFETVAFTNNLRSEWLRAPTNLFRLGPGDTIEVENLGQPQEPSILLLTGPDGKIYYSMLPGLSVWGLTLTETKARLENELFRYIRVKPQLAVTLRAVGSKRVWILGSVGTPGVYSTANPMTVLEAISLAGGPRLTATAMGGAGAPQTTELPDWNNSFLMRNGEMVRIDLHRLISQGDLSQNIYLQPDDFLYLRSSISRDVFVLGAVLTPNVVPYHKQLSLVSALMTVGGTAPYANVSHVAVVRGSLTMPRVAVIDYRAIYSGKAPDVLLEPGDIVYVPLVPYAKIAALVEQMIGTLVRTIAANEGNRAVIPNAVPIGVSGAVPAP